MDEPCNICGDVGVSDVVATCSLCKIAREHIYCMKKLCMELPVDWICEACEMGSLISTQDVKENLPKQHSSPVVEPSARLYKSGNNIKTSKVQYITPGEVAKLSSGAMKSESPTKRSLLSKPGPSRNVSSTSARFSSKPKGRKAAPLKFLPLSVIENSCSRAAGQLPPRQSSNPVDLLVNQQQAQTSRATREKKTCQVPGKEYVHKGHTVTRDFTAGSLMPLPNTEKKAAQLSRKEHIGEEYPMDTVEPSMESNPASTKKEEIADKRLCTALQVTSPPDTGMRTGQASETEWICCGQPIETVIEEQPKDGVVPSIETNSASTKKVEISDKILCAALQVASPPDTGCLEESRNSDANKGALVKILPGTEIYFPLPALDASWNGCFEILDTVCSQLTGGLRAHPPAQVLQKVYEFSKRMPKVLHFRMFIRNNVWNDIFKGNCPDANDIGLYFFSNNHKSENYNFLVDFIEKQNLGLSCYIDGVELLVFPSRLLTAESQRWSGQYFLWGIFRRGKKSVKCTGQEKLAIIPHPSEFTTDQKTVVECAADDDKLAIIPLPSQKTVLECSADDKLAIIPLPSELTNYEENIEECRDDNRVAIVPQPLEFTSLEETAGDDDDGVIDMDIDMVGGRMVGSVDVPVPRESSHNRTLETSSQQGEMSTPPSKKTKFKLCSPPPGFGPCSMRIRSNPPMVKPLQVDRTQARSPKPSKINFDRTPPVGLMR